MNQTIPETNIQHTVEVKSTSDGREFDRNFAVSEANTNNPMLPLAAPAASTPTAFLALSAPCNPMRSFFHFRAFQSASRIAGKIAGNARKRPPIEGPYFRAAIPVAAVTRPPKKNRTAIWHSGFREAPKCPHEFAFQQLLQDRTPHSEGGYTPNHEARRGHTNSAAGAPHHDSADHRDIDQKCDGPDHHGTASTDAYAAPSLANREPQSRQGDGRSCAEQSRKTFRFKKITDDREQRNGNTSDQKANQYLPHKTFRKSNAHAITKVVRLQQALLNEFEGLTRSPGPENSKLLASFLVVRDKKLLNLFQRVAV